MKYDLELIIKTFLAIVALITLGKAVYEYMQQRVEKRAQQFLSMRIAYRENLGFQNILNHLYGDKDFSTVNDATRIEFMGFFEDLAFLMNSGLIKKEAAFYMFGGDAIAAWTNNNFWSTERQEDKYWSLLKDFVNQMMEVEKGFQFDRKLLSFK